VIVDKGFFRVSDGFFDRMQLLCDFNAVSPGLNHRDRATEMALCAFQAKDNVGMRRVEGLIFHFYILSSWYGYVNA
jgi:hypothetical protein